MRILGLIESFNDPKAGLEAVNRLRPDVLFLDVEMPGLDGFGVIESLEHDCQVILNSTRAHFALNAFQYDQVKDYVTKPMKKDRFEKAIEKVVKNEGAQPKAEKLLTVPVYTERQLRAS